MHLIDYSVRTVLPIFLVMGLGFFIRNMDFLQEEFWDSANKFGFYVTLPTMLFKNIYKMNISTISNTGLIIYSVVALFGSILAAAVVSRLMKIKNIQKGAFIQGSFRSNFLILGVPLAESLFGIEGMGPTLLLLIVAIPLFNIVAVVILTIYNGNGIASMRWKDNIIKIKKNPLIIASAAAVLFVAFTLKVPFVIEKTIDSVASIATPLSLLVLGGQIDLSKVRGNISLSLIASSMRLIFIPAVVVVGAVLLGYRGGELGAVFILFSAPTAITSFIMAKNMNSDGQLAAQIVVLTTILSMITLPLGIYIMKFFLLI